MNLLITLLAFVLLVLAPESPVMWLYSWVLFVFGMTFLWINGVTNVSRICNDRACCDLIRKNEITKKCHNAQLIIAGYLFRGDDYRRVPKELFHLCPDNVTDDIQAYHAILEYYYYLACENYIKAERSLEKIRETTQISRKVYNIIQMEQRYLKILKAIWENKDLCDEREDIVLHESWCEGDIHRLRVEGLIRIYELLRVGQIRIRSFEQRQEGIHEGCKINLYKRLREKMNKEKSLAVIENFNETINKIFTGIQNYPSIYEGERVFCMTQIKNILQYIQNERVHKSNIE